MSLYQTIIMVKLASGETHTEDMYTTSALGLEPLKKAIAAVGAQFVYQTRELPIYTGTEAEAVAVIEEWALGHVDPSPPLAAPAPSPEFSRLNEVERTVTNQGRQLSEISTAIGELTKLVTMMAKPVPPKSEPIDDDDSGEWDRVPAPKPVARVDRRSARQRLAEFKGSPEHKENSMAIQEGASASPMPGVSTLLGGTGIVGVVGFDSNGAPIVGDLPVTTVGESFKRGNLAG